MTHTVDSLMALADAYGNALYHRNSNISDLHTALREALTEALEQPADCNALMLVKDCLMQANEQVNGPIVDTIWFSQTETLFDYIDSALQTAQPVREPMTDAQIDNAYCVSQHQYLSTKDRQRVIAFARAIECAHGIGVSK